MSNDMKAVSGHEWCAEAWLVFRTASFSDFVTRRFSVTVRSTCAVDSNNCIEISNEGVRALENILVLSVSDLD